MDHGPQVRGGQIVDSAQLLARDSQVEEKTREEQLARADLGRKVWRLQTALHSALTALPYCAVDGS